MTILRILKNPSIESYIAYQHVLKYYYFDMDNKYIMELEEKISDLKARWPAHSVPPHMWQQLEEVEEKLEAAKANNKK